MSNPDIRAGRKEWVALCVLLLPLLLVSMDVSVLYFAVPFISRTLQPTGTEQLWIFDIYGFVLAGLLITMGAVGDRIGRRRLLLFGAAAFGLASLAAAYAGNAQLLIGARAVLGIGGATLMPSTFALVRNMFHDPKQRTVAVGVWSGAMTSGISLGPVLSGFLLGHFWWGSVFLINIPFMLLLLVLAPLLVPEFKSPAAGRFDLVSSVLPLAAVLPVIYGIKEMAAHGFSVPRALVIVAGLAVGALFVRRQRRPDPMLPLDMFRDRGFTGAIVADLVAMFAIVGFAIFMTQYLQSVLGMRPLTAALWSLVPTLGVCVVIPVVTQLAQRVDRAGLVAGGFLTGGAGFAAVIAVRADSPIWVLLVVASVYAAGMVAVTILSNDMVMSTAPPERAGTASALLECGSEFGGSLGIALLGSIGTGVYHADMKHAPAGARETLAGATQLHDPGVLRTAREAFVHGMHAVGIAVAIVTVLAAVLALTTMRGVRTASR